MNRFNHIMNVMYAAVMALCLTATVAAAESNRNDVRANLEKDDWSVIYGKNITEADWARATAAIVASIATENPGPFLAWFEATMEENFDKIERNLKDVTRADLKRWIVQSLKDKKIITYKGFKIDAGFATYDRWERVVYDEPRTRKIPRPPFVETYFVRVERRTNLPNWHQFYIRYKLVESKPADNGGGGQVVKIEYTIKNNSGRVVRFQMQPSGKSYTLDAGKTFSGTSHEIDGTAPTITLSDSNHTYKLTVGNHKFWWMSDKTRIGFDRSTD